MRDSKRLAAGFVLTVYVVAQIGQRWGEHLRTILFDDHLLDALVQAVNVAGTLDLQIYGCRCGGFGRKRRIEDQYVSARKFIDACSTNELSPDNILMGDYIAGM